MAWVPRGAPEAQRAAVIDRYGGHRQQFYKHFASKAECYAAAYEFEVERLYTALGDRAGSEPSWHQGLVALLTGLGEFLCERPAFARGLLVEVHVAGGAALLSGWKFLSASPTLSIARATRLSLATLHLLLQRPSW